MRKSKYTWELLNPIIKESVSIGQVLDKLKLKRTGGNYRNIKGHIMFHEIDTSHFKGQGWAKGETASSHKSVANIIKKLRTPNEEIFISNSRYTKGQSIIKRLCEDYNKEYKCEKCGIDFWNEKEIKLQLEHKNGKHNDNRIENLEILCPNCHSQTETYCKKKAE